VPVHKRTFFGAVEGLGWAVSATTSGFSRLSRGRGQENR
jgi:hypothetical protein